MIRERTSVLRYTYIDSLVITVTVFSLNQDMNFSNSI
jgi:hypothetical protein